MSHSQRCKLQGVSRSLQTAESSQLAEKHRKRNEKEKLDSRRKENTKGKTKVRMAKGENRSNLALRHAYSSKRQWTRLKFPGRRCFSLDLSTKERGRTRFPDPLGQVERKAVAYA